MAEDLLLRALELTVSGVNYKQGQEEIDKLRRADEEGYMRCLLKVIAAELPSMRSTQSADALKVAACLLLKNAVRNHWETEQKPLSAAAAQLLKENIVPLALESKNPSREFLFESVRIIAQAQFPEQWPQPLPFLLQQAIAPYLQGGLKDAAGLELVANAAELLAMCLEKFMFSEASEELLLILKEILMCSQDKLCGALEAAATAVVDKSALADDKVCHATLRICLGMLKCIYYLHGVDLPEYFEDNLTVLMTLLAYFVSWRSASSAEESQINSSISPVVIKDEVDSAACHSVEDDPWLTDELKSYSFKLVGLYASRYTDEYQNYVALMTKEIVAALCVLSKHNVEAGLDAQFHSHAAITDGIEALNHTLRTRWEPKYEPFSEAVLNFTVHRLIPQNMTLSERDLQEMVDEPMNFISNDLSGLQRAAKRDSLRELISNLIRVHPQCADVIIASCQAAMKAEGQPLVQECACFLISSLCNEAQTRVRGVTQARRVDDMILYVRGQILPQLQNAVTSDGNVLLLTSYLKFIVLYRNFIPQDLLEQLVRCTLPLLLSDNIVIHSYAANFIDKILMVRYSDKQPYVNRAPLQEELNKCLPALQKKMQSDANFCENEFTFKHFWRLCAVCNFSIEDYAQLLKFLFDVTKKQCEKGGGNPRVCHYTFESIGTLLMKKQNLSEEMTISLHKFALEILLPHLREGAPTICSYSYQLLAALLHALPVEGQVSQQYREQVRALYSPILAECVQLMAEFGKPPAVNARPSAIAENLPTVSPSLLQCMISALYNPLLSDVMSEAVLKTVVLQTERAKILNRKSKIQVNQQLCTLLLAWLTRDHLSRRVGASAVNAVIVQLITEGSSGGAIRGLAQERNFMVTYCCYLLVSDNVPEIYNTVASYTNQVIAKMAKFNLNKFEKFLFAQTLTLKLKGVAGSTFLAEVAGSERLEFSAAQDPSDALLMEGEYDDLNTTSSSTYNTLISVSSTTFQSAILKFGQSLQ